jgi:SNF2 family DNA or RNA helicase
MSSLNLIKSDKRAVLDYVDLDDLNFVFSLRENPSRNTKIVLNNEVINFVFDTFGYTQVVGSKNHKIVDYRCNCYSFYSKRSCVHMACVLDKYLNAILDADELSFHKDLSMEIMKRFLPSKGSKGKIKKLCNVYVDIKATREETCLNLKIGENKLFVIRSKANSFFNTYYNDSGKVIFGKNFTYDKSYYFNDSDKELIDFAFNVYNYHYSNRDFVMNDSLVKQLFKLLGDREFSINGIAVKGICDFNFGSVLDKKDGNYVMSFDFDMREFIPVTSDFTYIFYHLKLYKIDDRYAALIKAMYETNSSNLIFDNKEMFSSSILPIVKNELEVTNNVDDIIIVKKPSVLLYFDMGYSNIILDLKFDYKGFKVSYKEKTDDNILRDFEYEDEIFNEMVGYGFSIKNKKIVLSGDDEIGYFLDNIIGEISLKYEVFTSEKLKKLNVVKESNVSSTFSIGCDNIMSYKFDLGDISSDEVSNIFASLKKKKKYYKLKNGNYLDLRDNNINELNNLCEDMELSSNDISNGSGSIPKYKAIYLDSLKDNRYHIINTNNLFDDFVSNFNTYKNMRFRFDKGDKEILRDYQEVGVKWLYNIYKCGFGGILADEMGLGKSLQTICFIKKVLKDKPKSKILIVTPSSLCYNWEKEILKFAPSLSYHILAESKSKRREFLNSDNDKNIYITSYGLLREDKEELSNINFEVCIIDEAQSIKNSNIGITKAVKSINSNCNIALTGTPIENSLMELWSIFDFLMPGFFGSESSFHSKYNVKSFDDDDKEKLRLLNKQISPFILRRKKSDVLKELPSKIDNNIYIDLKEEQKKLYATLVEETKKEMDEIVATEGFSKARFKILELLMRLRQVCIDPSIVYDNYDGGSAKIEEAVKVIKEVVSNGHKILLFSSFRTALAIMENKFKKEKISYYLIDGSVNSKKRMELVTKFNEDDTNVFLIMLKSGGTGLNLTSADVVIHLDLWWNPQVENQATDRAHRIGQENTVEVIRLVTRGTIEERILELQEKKKMLSDSVIEGKDRDQNIIGKLSEDDIKHLLSVNNDDE